MKPIGINKFGPGATTINPADKASLITLSNGDLTAVKNSGANWVSARATKSRSTGKWYFECTCNNTIVGSAAVGIGAGTAAQVLQSAGHEYPGNSLLSTGMGSNGTFYSNGTGQGTIGNWDTAGNRALVAVDLDAHLIWFSRNFGWNGALAGDPVAGTGGVFLPSGPIFPMVGVTSVGPPQSSITINFGATSFAVAPPSGYAAWG